MLRCLVATAGSTRRTRLTCSGTETCGGCPGTQGYEEIDANQFALWGFDYVKEDSCYAPTDPQTAFAQYAKMRDALNATGRPIFFALCGWEPWYSPIGAALGNSFRIGPDDTNYEGLLVDIDAMASLYTHSGAGGRNECVAFVQAIVSTPTAPASRQWPSILTGSSPRCVRFALTERTRKTQPVHAAWQGHVRQLRGDRPTGAHAV